MFAYRSLFDRPRFDTRFDTMDEVFRGFDRMLREMERPGAVDSYGYAPADLTEEADRFVLTVDVPGVTEKDVKVDFQEGVLSVTAKRVPVQPEGYASRRKERGVLEFSRSFVLGEIADPERTTAALKDGVLTVSIPKSKGTQKRSIVVKAS